MMRVWPLAALLVTAVLAGCVSDEGDDGGGDTGGLAFDPAWHEKALVYGGDHDHADRLHHLDLSTPNFQIVGYDPLISPHYGNTPAGYICGDAMETEDGRRIAVIESRSDIGFTIADVTNASAPQWLGELIMEHTYVYDLAMLPDGDHAVLVTSTPNTPSLPSVPTLAMDDNGRLVHTGLLWDSPCNDAPQPLIWAAEEDPVPRPMSILLVDIRDPTTPTIIDQRPIPGLGHSVFTTKIDGFTWILASMVGNPNVQVFQFYTLLDTPAGKRLELVGQHNTDPHDPPDQNPLGGHTDGWIQTHPVTGQLVAYVVGGKDFQVLDLAEPAVPTIMDTWTDAVPGRAGPYGNLHSVYPHTMLLDDRHYTVIGPEFGGHPEEQPSGTIWILDTSDPSDVKEVGAWTLPHEVQWDGTYMFSNHYLSVHNRTAFVSMYHGGVWALDLGVLDPDAFTLVPAVGVFMPTLRSPEPPENKFRWAPTSQEVIAFSDGTLVTFDSMSGIYTFRFDEANPAPAPEPWPVEPVTR